MEFGLLLDYKCKCIRCCEVQDRNCLDRKLERMEHAQRCPQLLYASKKKMNETMAFVEVRRAD